jgi:solute carrier family 25 (mitochondrial phosphate transporter), member 23/24/25/41
VVTRNARRRRCDEDAPAALPGQLVTAGIGAVSSSLGASIVYPLNLLRTRLQSQGTAIHTPTYTGWRDCLTRTVRNEGVRGLFKGLTPNLLKVVPSMSISYMVYEHSKRLIGLK